VFWDVEAWFEAMPNYDFVIGTRFHGAIAAIESGTPACVICHDTRTAEMCEFLGIPRLSLSEAQGLDIRAVYERTDMQSLADRYRQLYPLYKEFLEANNLPHRLL
jgi:polysaccharide pyruvyl transferase WcaK-like protein